MASTDDSTLSRLFIDYSYISILQSILSYLPWQDLVKSNRISQHLRDVISSSSKLQLIKKLKYHAIVSTVSTPQAPVKRQLRDLLTHEWNLQRLNPVSIHTIDVPKHREAQLSGHWLLLLEDGTELVDADSDRRETRGFSLWDASQSGDLPSTPASTDQDDDSEPSMLCRVKWGDEIHAMAFSVEENLLVVATRLPPEPHDVNPSSMIYQLSFFLLDGGRDATETGDWAWVELPHTKAAIATINIGIDIAYRKISIKLGPTGSGKIIVGLHTPDGLIPDMWCVWNWHKASSLGRIEARTPTDASPFGFIRHPTSTSAAFLDPDHIIYSTHGLPDEVTALSLCVSKLLSDAQAVDIDDIPLFSSTTGERVSGWHASAILTLPVKRKFLLGDLTRFEGLGQDLTIGPIKHFDVDGSRIDTTSATNACQAGMIALQVVGEVRTLGHAVTWSATCHFTISQSDILKAVESERILYEPEDWFRFVRVECTEAPGTFFRSHGARTMTFTPDDRNMDAEDINEEDAFSDTIVFADYSPFGRTAGNNTSNPFPSISDVNHMEGEMRQPSLSSTADDDSSTPCLFNHRCLSRDSEFGKYVVSPDRPISTQGLRRAVKADVQLDAEEIDDVLFDGKRVVICTPDVITVFSFV